MESPFNRLAGFKTCNFLKKGLQHRCFPVNIAKLLSTIILMIICEQLLLQFLILTVNISSWVLVSALNSIGLLQRSSSRFKEFSLRCLVAGSLAEMVTLCYSLSLVVPLVVIPCLSLSFFVIRCHSLSFVVTRCTKIVYHSLSFVVVGCLSLYHSLSLVVTRCTTRLSCYERSFCLTYSFKIFVSERKYKNNLLKIVNFKQTTKNNFHTYYLCIVWHALVLPRFWKWKSVFFKSVLSSRRKNTAHFTRDHVKVLPNEERNTFISLKVFPSCRNRHSFYFLEAKFVNVFKMWYCNGL